MSVLAKLKEILFPEGFSCAVCGREIREGKHICYDCKITLPYNDKQRCVKCGRAIDSFSKLCLLCKGNEILFDRAYAPFRYEEPVDLLVQRFKYGGERHLATVFAEYLVGEFLQAGIACDIITFVPMTARSQKARGYNQSEELARELAKRLSLPCEGVLCKVRETERQATLGFDARSENLQGAIVCEGEVKGKHVLLIDDVLTTGATASVCAAALKRKKAAKVSVLTVASTVRRVQ